MRYSEIPINIAILSSLILSLALISPLHTQAQIQDYITARAMAYDVRPDIAVAIVKAESGFDPEAHNASSSASGLGQFIDGTFKALCIDRYGLTGSMDDKDNAYVQVECLARRLSEPGGIKEWDASRGTWGKVLDES